MKLSHAFVRAFVMAIGAVAVYVGILAFPKPLFAYEVQAGNTHVYSRRPIAPGISSCLSESISRVRASVLYDPSITFDVLELHSPGWYRFFNGPYSSAIARHAEIGGYIFVPILNVESCTVEHFDGREAPISVILAHEMTHRLMQQRLGLIRVWRLPWWKREGYAEFVAERDEAPIAQRVNEFLAGNSGNALKIPTRYMEALIATRYLFEVRHMTFDELVSSDEDLGGIWSEIQREYGKEGISS